jgi:hypothetical protein
MVDGIYSGYIRQVSEVGEVRHGPGTLVHSEGNWRMEGIWAYNNAFICMGIKEYNDGEFYRGQFRKDKYDGKVSFMS